METLRSLCRIFVVDLLNFKSTINYIVFYKIIAKTYNDFIRRNCLLYLIIFNLKGKYTITLNKNKFLVKLGLAKESLFTNVIIFPWVFTIYVKFLVDRQTYYILVTFFFMKTPYYIRIYMIVKTNAFFIYQVYQYSYAIKFMVNNNN